MGSQKYIDRIISVSPVIKSKADAKKFVSLTRPSFKFFLENGDYVMTEEEVWVKRKKVNQKVRVMKKNG